MGNLFTLHLNWPKSHATSHRYPTSSTSSTQVLLYPSCQLNLSSYTTAEYIQGVQKSLMGLKIYQMSNCKGLSSLRFLYLFSCCWSHQNIRRRNQLSHRRFEAAADSTCAMWNEKIYHFFCYHIPHTV